MSTSFSIQWSAADIAAWQAQMKARTTSLGETKQEAARAGGITLLKSLQASTIVSRQRRTVRPSKSASEKKSRVGRNQVFVMETLQSSTGAIRNIALFYPDLETAKMHPGARIRKRGLAKQSWGWAMRDLFGKYSSQEYRGPRPNDALRYYVSNEAGEADSYIEIENRLGYIRKSLRGGGRLAVDTAMRRAANTIKGRIAYGVKKATREAGY